MSCFIFISLLISIEGFKIYSRIIPINQKQIITSLNAIEAATDTSTYLAIFAATLIPSLLLVKFVGDSADGSRGKLSEKTQNAFKKKMMQQPNINLTLPTSEEEQLKEQIAKAYIQDKDVDVAVLEEKLRQRIKWRKELNLQKSKSGSIVDIEDEGW